jgi:hypothetical protein
MFKYAGARRTAAKISSSVSPAFRTILSSFSSPMRLKALTFLPYMSSMSLPGHACCPVAISSSLRGFVRTP